MAVTPSNIVRSGRALGIFDRFPVELLAQIEPGLFVDAGAAFGEKTKAMLAANPASRVIAFEPFEGNLIYLRALANADTRVTVRPLALADRAGKTKFYVTAIISQQMTGRGLPLGGSVAGKLKPRPYERKGEVHEVPLARLDDEVREPVRFLKMDIQGGEFDALKGAERLFTEQSVDYLYVEFNGDLRVLNLLAHHGYAVFDCAYLSWPGRFAPRNWFRRGAARRVPDWPQIRSLQLTTGPRARFVWPPVPFRSFVLYCAWFACTRLFVAGLQTDLFCVHRSKLDDFANACVQARAALQKRDGAKA